MSEDEFWRIVSTAASGDAFDEDALREVLRGMPDDAVRAFQDELERMIHRLHSRPVLRAVKKSIRSSPEPYLSDDGLAYSCGWVVSQGRAFYEAVLAEPSTLLRVRVRECEEILYAAEDVLDERSGDGHDGEGLVAGPLIFEGRVSRQRYPAPVRKMPKGFRADKFDWLDVIVQDAAQPAERVITHPNGEYLVHPGVDELAEPFELAGSSIQASLGSVVDPRRIPELQIVVIVRIGADAEAPTMELVGSLLDEDLLRYGMVVAVGRDELEAMGNEARYDVARSIIVKSLLEYFAGHDEECRALESLS